MAAARPLSQTCLIITARGDLADAVAITVGTWRTEHDFTLEKQGLNMRRSFRAPILPCMLLPDGIRFYQVNRSCFHVGLIFGKIRL